MFREHNGKERKCYPNSQNRICLYKAENTLPLTVLQRRPAVMPMRKAFTPRLILKNR